MKLFRNNICYIEFEDLYKVDIPLITDKDKYSSGELVIINDHEQIKYLRDNDSILNYDTISNLSKEELELIIKRMSEELYDLPKAEFNKKLNIINNMIDYITNKEEIDNIFKSYHETQKVLKKNR